MAKPVIGVRSIAIDHLGAASIPSPLKLATQFIESDDRVLAQARRCDLEPERSDAVESFEIAGPRKRLFFDPAEAKAGIVTCGGLCPGLNDVIRALVLTLYRAYGAKQVLGFRYGYRGIAQREFEVLTPGRVKSIHEDGGTILGSSRGPQPLSQMTEILCDLGLNMLFTIGGDGTQRGAVALAEEIHRRGHSIAIVGIPKTIDNDVLWTERSFGFSTAVQEAARVLQVAHVEAEGSYNGVGLVRLMGRHSGFIAAHACLANHDVDYCFIPEVDFELDGSHGFLAALQETLKRKHHALVVVAEGAGQRYMSDRPAAQTDASGNAGLHNIGEFLRRRIDAFFGAKDIPVKLKYIDPSYIVRSRPANAFDSQFCLMLGQHAVHAAFSGRTKMLVGYWNQYFTHVPMHLAVGHRRRIDPQGADWQAVLQVTGQRTACPQGDCAL